MYIICSRKALGSSVTKYFTGKKNTKPPSRSIALCMEKQNFTHSPEYKHNTGDTETRRSRRSENAVQRWRVVRIVNVRQYKNWISKINISVLIISTFHIHTHSHQHPYIHMSTHPWKSIRSIKFSKYIEINHYPRGRRSSNSSRRHSDGTETRVTFSSLELASNKRNVSPPSSKKLY